MSTEKRKVISKWKKRGPNGTALEQVVYLTPTGQTVKGKPRFKSVTKHEPIQRLI